MLHKIDADEAGNATTTDESDGGGVNTREHDE